jgi:hypothetical protein
MNVLDLDVYVDCSRGVQSDELRSDEAARHPMDNVTIRRPALCRASELAVVRDEDERHGLGRLCERRQAGRSPATVVRYSSRR